MSTELVYKNKLMGRILHQHKNQKRIGINTYICSEKN